MVIAFNIKAKLSINDILAQELYFNPSSVLLWNVLNMHKVCRNGIILLLVVHTHYISNTNMSFGVHMHRYKLFIEKNIVTCDGLLIRNYLQDIAKEPHLLYIS